MNLETKIPPPAICFICALLMYVSAQVSALADILPRFPILLSVVFMVFGTLLSVLGVWVFRRVRTTVSPLNPEQTEHFVSDGVYRFSRNPMYAGLGCFGAPAAVVVFGCICCLYDTLSNHARRTRFGAEIRCRVRVLLSARPPLVIKAKASHQVSPLFCSTA